MINTPIQLLGKWDGISMNLQIFYLLIYLGRSWVGFLKQGNRQAEQGGVKTLQHCSLPKSSSIPCGKVGALPSELSHTQLSVYSCQGSTGEILPAQFYNTSRLWLACFLFSPPQIEVTRQKEDNLLTALLTNPFCIVLPYGTRNSHLLGGVCTLPGVRSLGPRTPLGARLFSMHSASAREITVS